MDSTLAGNTAVNGGALYLRFSDSQTTIVNSTLDNNQGAYDGGAILLWDGAAATIQNSHVTNNSANEGGGVYVTENASLTMQDSSLEANSATAEDGGAIVNYSTVTLRRVTLNENSSVGMGGGIYSDSGKLLLTDVTFSHNRSYGGGGISSDYNTNFLTNITFSNNVVEYQEYYSEGGGMKDSSSLTTMTNVTFTGNSADNSFGGGLKSLSSISTLTNVTFNNNTAERGGGIWYSAGDPSQHLTLKNTIVANSVSGGDCSVGEFSVNFITSADFNLSSDYTCNNYFIQPTDQTDVDPLLSPLAANGGLTMTHMPLPNSPVIDKGQCLAQVSTDQRGVTRPQGPACDIGAVERKTLENIVYLPMVIP